MGEGKRIKILILAANPKSTPQLRLDQEVREVSEGLLRAKQRDQFVLESKWAVRVGDLRRAMLDLQPNIVHFSGHGAFDGVVLETSSGEAQVISQEAISGLFELFRGQVTCVLLNACYSESQASAISQHIDYVIGMRKEIGDEAAIEFALGFYDALGAGRSYEDAFKFGCNAILLDGIPEHLTPVLHKKAPGVVVSGIKQKMDGPKEAIASEAPVSVFISYSHEDEGMRDSLDKHLSLLMRNKIISTWHDRKINPSEDWRGSIDSHLNDADIVLLLVSPDFLASDYCYDIEMQRAMERNDAGEVRVIPIILRPCDWQDAPFGKLQSLPKSGRPVTSWENRDEAFLNITQGIRRTAQGLSPGP